jgi:[ribosomal protein S5]-alanine N-acetyltransferase
MIKTLKNIFIEGKIIYLRILLDKDVDGNYAQWLNDPEITIYNSHGRFPLSVASLKEYVNNATNSSNMLVLAVVDSGTHEHIGNISLQNINWVDRNAEIAFLLGEKKYWGKGVMQEAGSLLIQHAFKLLNLHRVYCGTSSENKPMQKLASKLGMLHEGTKKEAMFKNGGYIDIVEFGILNKV